MRRRCARPSSRRPSRAAPKCWCASAAAACAIPTCICMTAISASAATRSSTSPAGRALPFTLGHEIAGVVEKAGPDADVKAGHVGRGVSLDRLRPMRGLQGGRGESLRGAAPSRHPGRRRLRHPCAGAASALPDRSRARSPASLAGAYMCSGLTAFSALKRIAEHAKRGPGAAGRARRRRHDGARVCARAVSARADRRRHRRRQSARPRSRPAPRPPTIPADPDARKALLKATGGVYGAVDFVGSDGSLAFAAGSAREGRQGRHHRPARRHLHDADRDVSAAGLHDRGHDDRHARRGERDDGARARGENPAGADHRAAAQRRAGFAR